MGKALLCISIGFAFGYLSGLLDGMETADAQSRVVAVCPNWDSMSVAANEWLPGDQQPGPRRIVYPPPECRK